MIHRTLLTSALIIAAIVAVGESAFAQTADIPFTGNVNGACNFGAVTPGTMAPNMPTNPTELAAGHPGGIMGKVSVICNQPARVAVSAPVQTGGPTFTPIKSEGYLKSPVGSTMSMGGSPLLLPTGNSIPLDIDARVVKDSPLVPGTYNYKVTLTITP
jgi:hypothetical protein